MNFIAKLFARIAGAAFCPRCGVKLGQHAYATVCPQCGQRLRDEAVSSPSPAPTQAAASAQAAPKHAQPTPKPLSPPAPNEPAVQSKVAPATIKFGESPGHGKGVPTGNERIARVIADLKDLQRKIEPLAKDTFPDTPRWTQLIQLSNRQVERAKTLKHADLPQVEPYLKSQDAETRENAAYIIKVVHLASPVAPLPTSTITVLGTLLRDSSDSVRKAALDTLYEVSKSTDVDESAPDLVATLSTTDSEKLLKVIEVLGNCRQKPPSVVKALQRLRSDESADIATAARRALDKLGVAAGQEDEKAAVQRLVWTWKASEEGMFVIEAAHEELKNYPNPMVVCSVLSATLLKGDWAKRDWGGGDWPSDFCTLLGDRRDPRFLDDLLKLYRAFEAKADWSFWSGHFAVAIIRVPGGWERMRRDLNAKDVQRFIVQALTCATGGNDAISDYDKRLSEEEKRRAIASILEIKKGDAYGLCASLARVGNAALEPLLNLYRNTHPKEAASAICDIPGALGSLVSRLSATEIERLISTRYEYSSRWNEDLVRCMGKLRTPRCIEWLKKEASVEHRDQAVRSQRKKLVESLLAG